MFKPSQDRHQITRCNMKSDRNVNGRFAASSRSGAPHTPASLGRKSPDISHGGKNGDACATNPKASAGRDMGKTADAANAKMSRL